MLSKKTQYAFKALTYLAEHREEGPVLIAEISKKKKIPLKFLENILLQLKKDGILASKKGKGGGYYFNLEPNQIPLSKIMRLVEGPIALLPCVSLNFYEKCKDCDEKKCGLNRVMKLVRDNTLSVLDQKTVQDLIA
ncbi:MAG: Rrf2 family transcriptional regulator [Chitinophagia bacterium]|jgi:Rrf2 family protein